MVQTRIFFQRKAFQGSTRPANHQIFTIKDSKAMENSPRFKESQQASIWKGAHPKRSPFKKRHNDTLFLQQIRAQHFGAFHRLLILPLLDLSLIARQ